MITVATMAAKPSWFAMNRPGDPALEVDDPREARVRCHACDRSYLAQEMDRDPTAGHQAICAECATSPAFYRASREEASWWRGRDVPGDTSSVAAVTQGSGLVDGQRPPALQFLQSLDGAGENEQARAER